MIFVWFGYLTGVDIPSITFMPTFLMCLLFVIPKVWEKAEEFLPERFDIDGAIPNETNTDFK